MALKKDKEKVLDEVWNEDRVKEFLDQQPPAGFSKDFYRLWRAYQQMRADDFALFVGFMKADGGDINDKNPKGETVLDIAKQHRNSAEFVTILS